MSIAKTSNGIENKKEVTSWSPMQQRFFFVAFVAVYGFAVFADLIVPAIFS